MYVFGFNEHLDAANTKTIVNAYLARNDHNIFVLDWSAYNQNKYIINAAPRAILIGILMGKILVNWFRNGVFEIKKFHLVGHSLGEKHFAFQMNSNDYFVIDSQELR